jgi:UDP-N-acetylmuramoylalanine--D-glutamate ligase
MKLPSRVLVLGLARSGQAATAALARRGVDVVGADRNLGNDEDGSLLAGVGLLVKSPGVPGGHPLVAEARVRGVPVWSEVELGYRLLHAGTRLVGVTGTKGKTTTCELLGGMFRAGGRDVVVAGNVGRPLTAVETGDWVVCELSSFQLEDVHELSCDVAVLLNLEADHLDRHGSFEAYRAAKLRILERAERAVVPAGSGLDGVEFSADDLLPAEPRIPGRHNRANAAAATAAARAAGLAEDAIAEGIATFTGVPHRLEPVRERNGVLWVNDSIATNTFAVRHGVEAYEAPILLILGGRAKGEDFRPFVKELPASVRRAYLVGEAAGELAAAFDSAGRACRLAGTLARAVELAAAEARAGDVVLLSPACASYDQYANFEERGEDFRLLVQNLEE